MFALYYAEASVMTMGILPSVEFIYIPTIDESLHCNVDSMEIYTDDYGDECIRVQLKFFVKFGYPVLNFRLLHPSGETGFELIETPLLIYKTFFHDAYLLTDQKDPLHPLFYYVPNDQPFYAQKGDLPMVVTFHQPHKELENFLELNRFSATDGMRNIKLLIETAHMCKAVMVWYLAYGTNPVVISTDSNDFISNISSSLKKGHIGLFNLDSDRKLPEW